MKQLIGLNPLKLTFPLKNKDCKLQYETQSNSPNHGRMGSWQRKSV
jgi:hypothetical protein